MAKKLRTKGDLFEDHRALVEFLLEKAKQDGGANVQDVTQFKKKKCAYCKNDVTPESAMNCIASMADVRGITEHISPMCPCAVAHLLDDEEEWAHTCQICQGQAVMVSSVFVDKNRTTVFQIIPGVVLYSQDHNRASVYIKVGEATGEWVEPSAIEVAMHKGTNNKWKSLCYVESPCGTKLVRFCDVPYWNPIGKSKVDIRCSRVTEMARKGMF
jgi:hypothetical protein